MAKNYQYRTVSFRLNMNDPLDRQLCDILQTYSTAERNKVIKSVLVNELIVGKGKTPKKSVADSDMEKMFNTLYDKVTILEKQLEREKQERATGNRTTKNSTKAIPPGEVERQNPLPPPEPTEETETVSPEVMAFLNSNGLF